MNTKDMQETLTFTIQRHSDRETPQDILHKICSDKHFDSRNGRQDRACASALRVVRGVNRGDHY